MLLSENLRWCSINGSLVNLLSITVERYLKVVHPSWNVLRKWVKFLATAFAWISSIAWLWCFRQALWSTESSNCGCFRRLELSVVPRHCGFHLRVLLLAHPDCYSSSGTRDDCPQRTWIKTHQTQRLNPSLLATT